jgi:WD40 repeat protein
VFSPDGRFVLSGSVDKTLFLWNIDTAEIVRQFIGGHTDWVTAVAFSPDGRFVVSGSRDRGIVLWDAETAQMIRQDSGHANTLLALHISPDSRYALSASTEGVVRLWPVSNTALLDWIATHRYVRELTCEERDQYRLTPCE